MSMEAEASSSAMKTDETTTDSDAPKWILPPPPKAPLLSSFASQEKKLYWDRSYYDSPAKQMQALRESSTLYVGNLAFTTRTKHIWSHFSLLGPVQRIHMGLDRNKKTPCGFCFVVYESRKHALQAVAMLSGTKLDGSVIRVELDAGFQDGRQYGRGRAGGQVRHDRKKEEEENRKRRYEGPDGSSNSNRRTPDGERGSSHAAEYYGPSGGGGGDDRDEEEDDTPSAKRRRVEKS